MRIFLPSDTDFSTNGEKSVNPVSCIEHREISDWYVECKFTLDDLDRIKQDYILIVETKEKNEQPFRIHNIEVSNTIYCRAYHVGYDTKNYAVELSTILNGNANACLVELQNNIEPLSTPFKFSSNINLLRSFTITDVSLYEALGKIASEYAGTLDFDGWNVYILDSIGQDRGISIEQGKNLVSATVTEDWSNVVTKLKPIGNNGITLTPEWLVADVSYDKPYTKITNFDTDTVESLELVAQLYLDRYKVPKINYSVKASLSKNGIAQIAANSYGELEAYTHQQLAEFSHAQITSTSKSLYFGIGDTIVVKARQFNVTTDIISYDYNCLTKYVIGIEFGNYRPTVKNFYEEFKNDIENRTTQRVQVKIDQLNGDFTIVANNYNAGLLSGTYYNFDGDAFTITNSLNETVFSADAFGNLTLIGDIQTKVSGILRTELTEESLKFYDATGGIAISSYADNYNFYTTTKGSESLTQWASLLLHDDSNIVSSQIDANNGTYTSFALCDVDDSFTYSRASLNAYNNSDFITSFVSVKSNGEVMLSSKNYTYKILLGGVYKTITVDGSGFLKAT